MRTHPHRPPLWIHSRASRQRTESWVLKGSASCLPPHLMLAGTSHGDRRLGLRGPVGWLPRLWTELPPEQLVSVTPPLHTRCQVCSPGPGMSKRCDSELNDWTTCNDEKGSSNQSIKEKRIFPLIYFILRQCQNFSDVLTLHILRVDRLPGVLAKEWSKWSTADGDERGVKRTHEYGYVHTGFWGETRFKQLPVTALEECLLGNRVARPSAAFKQKPRGVKDTCNTEFDRNKKNDNDYTWFKC